MEITSRALWTLLHGMGFGVLYLMGCSGMLAEFYRRFVTRSADVPQPESPFFKTYLLVITLLGWFAVLSGTYVVYPWYRAIPPAGTKDIKAFPQKFLISDPRTIGWHSMGMEWKEHVGWLVPITITVASVMVIRYGKQLRRHPTLRSAVLGAVLFSFASSTIAGFWGAMIDKSAPVEGGRTITVIREAAR